MEASKRQLEIIDYLYGEMTAVQKAEFEQRMARDEELRKEVESLSGVRASLQESGEARDKDFAPPVTPILYLNRNDRWLRPWMAVAASVVLLFVVGYLTGFSIRTGDQGLFIGFAETNNTEMVDEQHIEKKVDELVEARQAALQEQLKQTQDSLQMYFALLNNYKDEWQSRENRIPKNAVSESELKQQMEGWQSANRELLQTYLTAVNKQQQAYLQDALMQFSDYLRDQREEDLLTIQQNLIDLKMYQDQQKIETNEVLAELIKTVQQQK